MEYAGLQYCFSTKIEKTQKFKIALHRVCIIIFKPLTDCRSPVSVAKCEQYVKQQA